MAENDSFVENEPESTSSMLKPSLDHFHKRNLSLIASIQGSRAARKLERKKQQERKKALKKMLEDRILRRPRSQNALQTENPDSLNECHCALFEPTDGISGNSSKGVGQPSKAKSILPTQSSMWRSRSKVSSMRACESLSDWKRRMRVDNGSKVFIIRGGYVDLKIALEKMGWVENKESDSQLFDLKWTLNAKEIDYKALTSEQIVNHFVKNTEISTKVGLTNNLKECSDSSDLYYPRAFDLSKPIDRADFVSVYKLNKVVCILKLLHKHVLSSPGNGLSVGTHPIMMTYSTKIAEMALKICERSIRDMDEVIDSATLTENVGIVSQKEWNVIKEVSLSSATELAADADDLSINSFKTEKPRMNKKHEAHLTEYYRNTADGQALINRVSCVLSALEKRDPQFYMNGDRNMWIIKPAGKSRGRGVELKRNLIELSQALFGGPEGEMLVCQKYIETPQIIHGYKFDIRQWVLVTDWNPLTVYIWKEPYIRFASKKFDPEYKDASPFVHLVNNSINKDSPLFNAHNEELNTDDYMWFRQDYEKWLHNTYCQKQDHSTTWLRDPPYSAQTMKFDLKEALEGKYGCPYVRPIVQSPKHQPADCHNHWTDHIAPQIKNIILSSLRSAADNIEHRKASCELFGYDFMLSDDNKVWLIEVNSSPAMDYSTHVTAPLIKIVMEDTAKIVAHLPKDPPNETGEWELAYKSSMIFKEAFTPLRRLELTGKQIKAPQVRTGLPVAIIGIPSINKPKKSSKKKRSKDVSESSSVL